MSAAVLSYDRSSTPVVEIPPVDIDLTQDWGETGPPPPRAPRLLRHNAMVPPSSEDESEVEIPEVPPRALFHAAATAAAPIEEHVAGMHADLPLLDRIHFTATFHDDLYDRIHELMHEPMTLANVTHNFKTILSVWNHGIDAANILRLGTAVYVVPLMMPTGNTWRFQTFQEQPTAESAGAIPIKDLGISEDLALEYMACDYLRQTFVNPRYCGRASLPPAAAIAEINTILEHQCALHMALVGFIVK